MMKTVKHTVSSIGSGAIDVVDRIGRKRSLIGLAIIAAAAAGAIVAVKMLRRHAAKKSATDMSAADAPSRRAKRETANPNGASAGAH
jgi:hypothetical protein